LTQAELEIAGFRIASSKYSQQKSKVEELDGTDQTQRPSSAPSVLIVTSNETSVNSSAIPLLRPMSSTLNSKRKSDFDKILSIRFALNASSKQSMKSFTADIKEGRILTLVGNAGKRDVKGNTLLHEAVENGHTNDVLSLIESRASVNAANRFVVCLQMHFDS
jgi:ankyrin repeat protein